MTDDDPLAGGDVQEAAGLPGAVDADSGAAALAFLGAFDVDAIATKMQDRAEAAVRRSFEEESAPSLVYGSADEWLRKYWRYTYRRRVSAKGQATGRWRADWWTVDEAVQRIEALWRSWEASRLDAGLGMSAWWINHAEPHMHALLSTDGPFMSATDENLPGEPLPYLAPPAGMFDSDKQT